MPCCSSIFAKISGLFFALLSRDVSSFKSLSVLAKDNAMKSTPHFNPSFISLLSLEVRVGSLTVAPGKLTCFLPAIMPASKTLQSILSLAYFFYL